MKFRRKVQYATFLGKGFQTLLLKLYRIRDTRTGQRIYLVAGPRYLQDPTVTGRSCFCGVKGQSWGHLGSTISVQRVTDDAPLLSSYVSSSSTTCVIDQLIPTVMYEGAL